MIWNDTGTRTNSKRDGVERKIRVLAVGPSFVGGGAQNHFRIFSGALARRLVTDICILAGDESDHDGDTRKKIIALKWRSKFSYPLITLKLLLIVRRGNYDTIVSFGLFPSAVSWLAMKLLRRRPKLMVMEITRPWAALKRNGWFRSLLYQWLYGAVYHSADVLAANSYEGLEECKRYFHLNSSKAVVLPNLIDRDDINRLAEMGCVRTSGKKKQIIAAARLIRTKRFDTLLEAAALLLTDQNWEIIILGDGPERKNLEALVKKRKLSNRVRFVGWVNNPFPFLKQSSVFVLCSEYEGFSNALLEAMFLGVPVVTSFYNKDVRDMCLEGAAKGFEVGDAMTLAQHVSLILNSDEESERLRQTGYSYCKKHEVRNSIKIYERVIIDISRGYPVCDETGGQ